MRKIFFLYIFTILIASVRGQENPKSDTTFHSADGKSFTNIKKGISTDTLISSKKKYKKIYIYTWGLRAYFDDDNSCTKLLHSTFGFDYKTKAGCVVKEKQVKRWQQHNEKVEKKLVSRFGNNWKEKYQAEYIKCVGK